jgi:glycosyltransferase involved in cell wall biosynthesis
VTSHTAVSASAPIEVADDEVTLILPCLNEELAIGQCISDALAAFEKAGLNGHVLVVDNGSADRSVDVARAAGAQVALQAEPGYGAALRSGIAESRSNYVVMADADGTYEMEAIPRLLKPVMDGTADLVLGSRLNHATNETMPWLHRYVGTPLITLLLNRATGNRMKVKDSQSGFRAFRRDQILQLGLAATGMEFASEMLIRSARAKLRIVEIPTTYSARIGDSKLNTFSDGLRHLRQILLLSPEIFAIDPGMIATLSALLLWGLASISVHGLDRVGTLSWAMVVVASTLSVIGPITFCTGLVIKYRAESLGLWHSPPKYPLLTIIWRFFFAGIGLLLLALMLLVMLVVNYHQKHPFLVRPYTSILSSVTVSSAIVGFVLACAPVLTPFLTQVPRRTLPKVDS